MNRGYVKLWRNIYDSGILANARIAQLFFWLMVKASSCQRQQIIGQQAVILAPGQVVVGRKMLAAELGSTEQQVRTALTALQKMGLVSLRATNRFTVVTLLQWQLYQGRRQDFAGGEEQDPARSHPLANRQPTTIKETMNCLGEGAKTSLGLAKGGREALSALQRQGFFLCWQVYPVQQGREEALREWTRLWFEKSLPEPRIIREAIERMIAEDSRWRRGKVPNMAKWLSRWGWNDLPFVESSLAVRAAPKGHIRPETYAQGRDFERRQRAARVLHSMDSGEAAGGGAKERENMPVP